LGEHGVRGLLVLTLLLDTVLIRVILPLLLQFEAFLAAAADLLGALRLVLELGRSGALWRPGRRDERLAIFVAVYDYC